MSEYKDLIERLRGKPPTNSTLDRYEAADALEAQAKRIEELQNAFREIYEVYAGSEGFIPETCAEGYQQQLIKEMSDIAAKYMRKGLGEKQ